MRTTEDSELIAISDKWWSQMNNAKQSLLFSKYPMINGSSLMEHIALMYLFEQDTHNLDVVGISR